MGDTMRERIARLEEEVFKGKKPPKIEKKDKEEKEDK